MKRPFRTVQRGLAISWLSLLIVAALLAPSTVPTPDLATINQPPFHSTHWLGTTSQGLDVGMSLWQGARTLLLVSVPAALCTLLLGGFLGGIAGYWGNTGLRITRTQLVLMVAGVGLAGLLLSWFPGAGGWPWLGVPAAAGLGLLPWRNKKPSTNTWPFPVDSSILALIALVNSVPLLVLVVAVASIQRPSLAGVVALLSLTCWPTPARLMRAATLQSRSQPYIEAAQAAGLPAVRILWRHISPNALPVLLVRFPLTVAVLISLETTLSFLGVGLPPETPSWGRLLAAVRQAPANWWLMLWPGLAIAFTILSLQYIATSKEGE
ncbi:ABC transporter permease [Hymenobacter metallilatus]|uniref:ABC transporter permease n=1 Tax=Hymenobacter metallilatus TaxID=2493666 RepID=A0A428JPQ1_9BACT|nr:ABC transporter permease [Hymenobacter metallilatus]RSK35349.1 ABC transporter permease [Hymenobacter metallilatus]